jgi:uncharacterized sporulation protein YeaH/YhbH (DUF444 family)
MPNRIQEDHKKFRDVISGRTRKELKRLIKSGAIIRQRPKGGKMTVSIPQIDIPHFLFGDTGKGVGRGPGKDGEVIGKDPQPGKGSKPGDQPGEGINISVDMEDVLRFMQEELQLPECVQSRMRLLKKSKLSTMTFQRMDLSHCDILVAR